MKSIPIYALFLFSFSETFAKSPEQLLTKSSIEINSNMEEFYIVKSGDILSNIIQQNRHLAPELSFYEQMNYVVRKNGINNPDILEVGQRISLNRELSEKSIDLQVQYPIKYGDTLFKVLAKLYGKNHFKEILPFVLENNPSIKDINYIIAGKFLKLPSRLTAQRLISKSRAIASVNPNHYKFTIDEKVKKEISFLSSAEAKNYNRLYKNIMKTESKKALIVELKDLLELSRTLEHEYLEDTFLQLITSALKSKQSDAHLSDLRLFFITWKDSRNKEKYSL
jgi:hypothetical protein